jgi:xanthine dehydrogenase accessory factor
MRELTEILKRVEEVDEAILATLVDIKGSGYRLAGARMLIDANGYSIGILSGGCLEADILERAKRVLQTGEPTLVTYDTTKDENSIFGLGMGCRGVSRVLLESIENNNSLDFIRRCIDHRQRGVISTVIAKGEADDLLLGDRFYTTETGDVNTAMYKTAAALNGFFASIHGDAVAALETNRSQSKYYETANGTLEIFHEVINPPTSILIFGAGHDAVPLAEFAARLGWHTSVIDHRPARASKEVFPSVDRILLSRPEDLPDDVFADPESVAVLMNHNYNMDRDILDRLLDSRCRYIGMLGPRHRTDDILGELSRPGRPLDEQRLANLYTPAGLDIGAATPEAIALSIIAEIQAVLSGRDGAFLRDRAAPIYER